MCTVQVLIIDSKSLLLLIDVIDSHHGLRRAMPIIMDMKNNYLFKAHTVIFVVLRRVNLSI